MVLLQCRYCLGAILYYLGDSKSRKEKEMENKNSEKTQIILALIGLAALCVEAVKEISLAYLGKDASSSQDNDKASNCNS